MFVRNMPCNLGLVQLSFLCIICFCAMLILSMLLLIITQIPFQFKGFCSANLFVPCLNGHRCTSTSKTLMKVSGAYSITQLCSFTSIFTIALRLRSFLWLFCTSWERWLSATPSIPNCFSRYIAFVTHLDIHCVYIHSKSYVYIKARKTYNMERSTIFCQCLQKTSLDI